MPLSLTKRGAVYYLRGTVKGKHCYETTGTSDPELAEACRITREKELYEEALFGPRATASFERAALSYLDHQERSKEQKAYVRRLVARFGNTPVSSIDQATADDAVRAILPPGAKPSTKRRNVLGPLTAVLNHAAKRKWCDHPRFDLPKVPKGRVRWLTPEEALKLEINAAPHLRPLIRFCLCTGARVGEALGLDWQQVDLAAGHVLFLPDETKAEKLRRATLPPAAIAALSALPFRQGAVFLRPVPKRKDKGLVTAYGARGRIKTGWTSACRRAGLGERKRAIGKPDRFIPNVRPHDLRHTWATWFYAASKDPLLLKHEGGWASLAMVERYAHLMPADLVPEIAQIWGPTHPRIGPLVSTETVQSAG